MKHTHTETLLDPLYKTLKTELHEALSVSEKQRPGKFFKYIYIHIYMLEITKHQK